MKLLLIFVMTIVIPSYCCAWNGNGHSTSGAIAYYYLKANNPATISKIRAILLNHPWYNKPSWTSKFSGLTGEQKDVALFMLASTFPDDARDDPDYGGPIRATWHYIDYPFVPAGETVTGESPKSPNAEEKINELLSIVGTESDLTQQAVDLCWIFHLIEDVHQPLHTVSMFTSTFPQGDRGGNEVYISFGSHQAVVLHSYWDALIKGTFSTIPTNAQRLLAQPSYSIANLTELQNNLSIHDWISKESFVLAEKQVYQNGQIRGTKNSPTAVSSSYANSSGKEAERRIVLAGIRVAQKLTEILP